MNTRTYYVIVCIMHGRSRKIVTHRITSSGQVSLPAEVRKRWATRTVALQDLGDKVIVTPLADDPISAARGALEGRIPPTTKLRVRARKDEAHAEARR